MPVEAIAVLNSAQIQDLHQLYQETWWGKGRSLVEIQKMLSHSDLIVGLCDTQTQKLVGFGRVLTDYVYRAVIWDVIVEPTYQGQGLGRTLMTEITNHPALQYVECFMLVCLPEVVPFYEKLGFTDEIGSMQLMIKTKSKSEFFSS